MVVAAPAFGDKLILWASLCWDPGKTPLSQGEKQRPRPSELRFPFWFPRGFQRRKPEGSPPKNRPPPCQARGAAERSTCDRSQTSPAQLVPRLFRLRSKSAPSVRSTEAPQEFHPHLYHCRIDFTVQNGLITSCRLQQSLSIMV